MLSTSSTRGYLKTRAKFKISISSNDHTCFPVELRLKMCLKFARPSTDTDQQSPHAMVFKQGREQIPHSSECRERERERHIERLHHHNNPWACKNWPSELPLSQYAARDSSQLREAMPPCSSHIHQTCMHRSHMIDSKVTDTVTWRSLVGSVVLQSRPLEQRQKRLVDLCSNEQVALKNTRLRNSCANKKAVRLRGIIRIFLNIRRYPGHAQSKKHPRPVSRSDNKSKLRTQQRPVKSDNEAVGSKRAI